MSTADPVYIDLLVGARLGPAARHGLTKVQHALRDQGVSVVEIGQLPDVRRDALMVIGLPNSPAVELLAADGGFAIPASAEALCTCTTSWQGTPTWLVVGADDRGLMYALLDVADRIGWAPDRRNPFSEVRDVSEDPAVAERGLSIYTMHKADFERRFYSEAYWARYLDMLAQNRFNTFALLLAYENAGYMAPPYPYFFDVQGFPMVKVSGYTAAMQARNLDALNRLIAMAHERGLRFTLGIWDHIYRGGVQTGGVRGSEDTLRWRVTGLTQDNLMDYSVAALTQLLCRVPNLDALQFRMHNESGLKAAEMDAFWDRIYDVLLTHAPNLRFDARAKEFPDHLIDLALKKGIKIRICTKVWMEQMGLPFHPTHIHPQDQHNRRHSYADLLRYPQRYAMLWRLWNGGTNRVTLWGDPEYARRFAESTHLYGGEGFEVNEPLATKMAAHDHDAEPFDLLHPDHRYYDWEFERYWHFFQVFGRLGYNPNTQTEIWDREFVRRFGPDAAPHVAQGLHLASRVLPRIVAYTYPYRLFPTTRGWVEKQHMGSLPDYATALPSDTEQFLSIADEAHNQIVGGASARIRPQASAAWFARVSEAVLTHVALAEERVGAHRNREFAATMVDLRILAYLALYHARRARAGVQWALFEQSQDLNALDASIDLETQAIAAWMQIVEAAGDVYASDLMMGLEQAGLSGHWRDELTTMKQELVEIAHTPVRKASPGHDLEVRATACGPNETFVVRVCFSSDEHQDRCIPMHPVGPWRYKAVIPGDAVVPGLHYTLEAVVPSAGTTGRPHAGASTAWPEPIVAMRGAAIPIAVIVSDDVEAPKIHHAAIATAPAGQPMTIRATVQDPSGVQWVHLRYRSVTQFEDYKTLEMLPADEADLYTVTVPAHDVDPRYDFMYYIEAMDTVGNGVIYPDLEIETPYVVVSLTR
ncbi:MAG: hypothetical protein MUF84_14790 [Anaerolineae bacterium]|nr:hypothetical protein [Anaerolineae bacterium]